MRELIDDIKDIKVAIFDLDGVVYRTSELIPNADKVIQDLKDAGIRVVYNSNNSTITRQMYVQRLNHFGIESKIDDFYTSAYITASEITKIKKNAKVFVIGEIGIREEFKALGHQIVKNPSDYKEIDFVIVGLDLHLKYNNLAIALNCILKGDAQFYATNDDTTLPAAGGIMPGAGVMVKALETCSGMSPVKVYGKPNPIGIELILKDYDISPENACIFGDRMETDIVAGNRAGIKTVGVLTGIYSREMMDDLYKRSKESKDFDKKLLPDLLINTLDEIFKQ